MISSAELQFVSLTAGYVLTIMLNTYIWWKSFVLHKMAFKSTVQFVKH